MSLFGNDDDRTPREKAEERQQERQMEQSAFSAAASQSQRTQEVTENANFLRELRRAGVGSEKYHWLRNELGPALADSHVIGNRGEDYEQESKWGNIGKSMQHIAERSPGRHCRDERALAIAQGTHKRTDVSVDMPYTEDEKRVLREGYDAATNYQSLSVEGRGGEMVGETTVTARREVREEDKSAREKVGGLLD
jgi:hypothetical protein